MCEEISAKAKTPESADLTMTRGYLVIKGKHYQVSNGYLYRSIKTQAIPAKDILSAEYLTIRSKRLFILFMILMTLVVFGSVEIKKMFSIIQQIDKEVQKVEKVYNYVADEEIDISITSAVRGVMSEIGIVGVLAVYIVLIIGSVVCFLGYLLRPFRVLYISTIGKIIAVERKFYDKSNLDNLINTWKMGLN